MCNIIVFNNNLSFVKKYHNILVNFSNAKIVGIVSNKTELLNICKSNKIDLIILNKNSYNRKNIQNILKNIKKKIIIDNTISSYKFFSNQLYVSDLANNKLITNVFNKFISNSTEKNIKENTRKLLKSLNFDFKLKGTNYLLESIVYSYLNKNEYLYDNLEKNIYTHISKKHNVSTSVIKHSIIRSINNTNSNCLKSIFKDLDRITSKSFITEIINLI